MASTIQDKDEEEIIMNEIYCVVKSGIDYKMLSISPSKLKTYLLNYIICMNTNGITEMNTMFNPLIRKIIDSSTKTNNTYSCGYFKRNLEVNSLHSIIDYCDNPVQKINQRCEKHTKVEFNYDDALFSLNKEITEEIIESIKETNIYLKLNDQIAGKLIFKYSDLKFLEFLDSIEFEIIDVENDIRYAIIESFVQLLEESQCQSTTLSQSQSQSQTDETHVKVEKSDKLICSGTTLKKEPCKRPVSNDVTCVDQYGNRTCTQHSIKSTSSSKTPSSSSTSTKKIPENRCFGIKNDNTQCTRNSKVNCVTEDGHPCCMTHVNKKSIKSIK
jgi:hypothetical protein